MPHLLCGNTVGFVNFRWAIKSSVFAYLNKLSFSQSRSEPRYALQFHETGGAKRCEISSDGSSNTVRPDAPRNRLAPLVASTFGKMHGVKAIDNGSFSVP